MSWLFSQALVEASLGDSYSDLEQSVLSNGNIFPQAYCSFDKTQDYSHLSQYGMTFRPLMESLGEELLTLFREDFLAKTCQQQTKEEMDLMENDQDSGLKWGGLLARLDPDTSLWRTLQCSLITDSEECLETFPKWGLMQDGGLWEQTPLAHPTEGNDFGWLPTPVATDYMTGKLNGIEYRNKRFIRTSLTSGTEFGAKLADAFRLMTTKALPPNFSEWMMGLPIGWTELKPVATPRCRPVQQKLGEF